jgi:hypothetical protein
LPCTAAAAFEVQRRIARLNADERRVNEQLGKKAERGSRA